jgi:hypothetical protein
LGTQVCHKLEWACRDAKVDEFGGSGAFIDTVSRRICFTLLRRDSLRGSGRVVGRFLPLLIEMNGNITSSKRSQLVRNRTKLQSP